MENPFFIWIRGDEMSNSITAGIREYQNLQNRLNQITRASETVAKKVVGDFKTRAPAWISKEVVKVYNIKKSEITPTRGNGGRIGAGSVSSRGNTISSVSLEYKGRLLTPTHFGMTPKTPKPGGNYTLKAQILKGQKKTLGKNKKLTKKQRTNIGKNFRQQGSKSSPSSPIMLLGTGATSGGVGHIPFQRKSQRRNDLEVIKTLSMPQMVSNPIVQEEIGKSISENMGKRIEHYMERYMPR